MTKLEFTVSDEKAAFLLRQARLYDQPAKWIEAGIGYWNGDTEYIQPVKCSECGAVQDYSFDYCPDCGARMKIEEVVE